MKILLVATNRSTTPFPVYPIGLDYVATAVRDRHDVRTLDMACDGSDDLLATICRDWLPDVVGLSIRNIDNVEAEAPHGFVPEIARVVAIVRDHCRARVVLGGPGFSIFPESLMRRLGADYGIAGEGERLVDLLDAVSSNATVAIPGVLVGDKSSAAGTPWSGQQRRQLASPETVQHYLRWGGMLNVQTKRGCPFRCSYCTYPTIEGHALRLRPPSEVADEWQALVDAGARFLFVADALFNSDVQHNLAVASALQERGLTIPWGAFFAPLRPPPDYYRRLRAAGLTHVEFGTESFSPAMLRAYRKPFSVGDALAAHAEAKAAGLHVCHYIMLGGPGETPETVEETLSRCDAITDAALFFFCGPRIYPSTELHAIALAEGQIDAADDLVEPCFYVPPQIGLQEIRALLHKHAAGRTHWVTEAGSPTMAKMMTRMYQRGRTGPLWERLLAGTT